MHREFPDILQTSLEATPDNYQDFSIARSKTKRTHNLEIWRSVSRGRLGGESRSDFCVAPHRLDATSAGQTGHFHRTNRTNPRDGCRPKVEVSCHMPFCLLVFVFRGRKINANFFGTKFFNNPSGHGRPRRKSWTSTPKSAFSCGPVVGRNFLTPGHSGIRVKNVRGKSGPKSLCLCCFFFPESSHFKQQDLGFPAAGCIGHERL